MIKIWIGLSGKNYSAMWDHPKSARKLQNIADMKKIRRASRQVIKDRMGNRSLHFSKVHIIEAKQSE